MLFANVDKDAGVTGAERLSGTVEYEYAWLFQSCAAPSSPQLSGDGLFEREE